jgi:acylphosphatase
MFAEIWATVEAAGMSSDFEIYHETVHYSGRVQGVGFRYTTVLLSREYDVSGIVQNLADGRVRVEIEGEKEDVDAFLAAIAERMQGYVRHVDRESGRRAPQFSGFSVR